VKEAIANRTVARKPADLEEEVKIIAIGGTTKILESVRKLGR